MDEIEEIIINLKTQLEHAKKVEESLKIQLTKKEETCHMLKLEIVNLKKMDEKIKSRMETPSMAISFLVIVLAIKQWTARN